MSTYLGLDIATTTGWAFLEDDRLIEKGSIHLNSSMDMPQKLHFFHLELKNLLFRLRPERIFIEDVFLGISGAKTLAYLSRLNGVAINTAFEFVQERVKLYEPTYWKAHSFLGLNGAAKKWEIQLAVIAHYNIRVSGDFSAVSELISEKDEIEEKLRNEWDVLRKRMATIKSQLVRKRDPIGLDEKLYLELQLKETANTISNTKRLLNENEKLYDKKFTKISVDVTAQTGMSDNICDACGIAYCGYKETIANAN